MSWPIDIQIAAIELLAELESHQLVVGLSPTRWRMNEGGCVRVVLSKNATWYRRFCAQYPSSRIRRSRAFDTLIKRASTISTLTRISKNKPVHGRYADRLVPILRRQAAASLPCAL